MILSCQNICKSFGEKIILKDASFHIEDREKAALIGNNGAGKTTLLRIIMHELSPDSGNVVLAKDKNIGYLAQYQDIHGHHTIYEELISTKQHIIDMENRLRSLEQEMKTTTGDALDSLMNTYTRLSHQFELENGYAYKSEIMGVLKGLGFTEEDFERQIETLSGGQKTRVALGKLLLASPDILLLDEPTNHLDMRTKDILTEALRKFEGTVIVVSHDRDFLTGLADKVYEFANQHIKEYLGGITDFLAAKKIACFREYEQLHKPKGNGISNDEAEREVSENKLSFEERKQLNKEIRKAEQRVERAEQRVTELESEVAALEKQMAAGVVNDELLKKYGETQKELEEAMTEWEKATEEEEEVKSKR